MRACCNGETLGTRPSRNAFSTLRGRREVLMDESLEKLATLRDEIKRRLEAPDKVAPRLSAHDRARRHELLADIEARLHPDLTKSAQDRRSDFP